LTEQEKDCHPDVRSGPLSRRPEEVTLPALIKGFPVEWEGERGW
jgi:hypothetical protein